MSEPRFWPGEIPHDAPRPAEPASPTFYPLGPLYDPTISVVTGAEYPIDSKVLKVDLRCGGAANDFSAKILPTTKLFVNTAEGVWSMKDVYSWLADAKGVVFARLKWDDSVEQNVIEAHFFEEGWDDEKGK